MSASSTKQKKINRGLGRSVGRGVDLALVPVVFGGIGWLIDRALGTDPWFAIILGTFAVVGTFVKMKLGYDREMDAYNGTAATRPREVKPTLPGAHGEH